MADVKLSPEMKQKLEAMAAGAGLSQERLVATLLEAFVEGGGKVFVGPWKEGPGVRVLPDWPKFSSKVARIAKGDMK